jgi:hypothetical protein
MTAESRNSASIEEAVARQRRGKKFPAAKNKRATVEEHNNKSTRSHSASNYVYIYH